MGLTRTLTGSIGVSLILGLTVLSPVQAKDLRLTQGVVVSFAGVKEAKKVLGRKDGFVTRMSPFDRSARMKTARKVGQREFRAFAAKAARPWQKKDMKKVTQAIKALKPKLARLRWKLPKRILMIKTSGLEEGHAAYTRGNAIILPSKMLGIGRPKLEALIAHEFFHILSRHNPKLRQKTYRVVGFVPCGEVSLPKDLQRIKITNPDAPKNDHLIRVSMDGLRLSVVPILFSKTPTYNTKKKGEFFDYLNLGLMVVEVHRGKCRPLYNKKHAVLLEVKDVSNFFEQVGGNSALPAHPEEILADNFTLLMTDGKRAHSPKLIAKLKRLILR